MRARLEAAVVGALWLAGGGVLSAADYRRDWFPFVIPDLADAETAGTPIDMSRLSPEPAGAHGFLRPRGERIVDGRGVPVRLFGTNICDYHAMPPKAVAPAIHRPMLSPGGYANCRSMWIGSRRAHHPASTASR